jgi:ABC-type nitrate/sulfonate/bicarbonate transport system substrate-binding protein
MVLLGYRDRNVHELVVHETAFRAGSYARLGVDVQTVAGQEHPEAPLSAGLGGSLIETLKGHRTWCAGLVHTLHPLFWVWGRGEGAALTDLRSLAGHPDGSIVSAFTDKLLEDRGLRIEALDVERFPVGIPGDHERLKALTSGSVDAAVLGTAFAPTALARLGLTQLMFFGNAMMFPTAGLGIDAAMIDPDGSEVRAVIDAQREALELIKAEAAVAVDAVAALLPESLREDAERLLRDYVAPNYGPTPEDVETVGSGSVAWLSDVLAVEPGSVRNFYEKVR